ncbi:hypothetical protein A6F68_01141 [Tsuneonella dongtanensis]|uniref:Uncharacterized protein n=1 Tax=Tsuneonella dongtanensis TaxID=692370 RepID=A0A1B2ABW8_9SPHN|nr:hypothetical protein A6F68_01141 [Tsuneonella dongtanensis]
MSSSQSESSENKPQSWENEGGSTASADAAATLGIVRHMSETYSVGGYRYTTLGDAIAQARRMAKLENELLGDGG